MMATVPAPEPTTLITARIPLTMKERVEWMAKAMNRSRNYVFIEALQRYLDQEEWQLQDIVDALEEAGQEEGTDHDEVMAEARSIVEQARNARHEAP